MTISLWQLPMGVSNEVHVIQKVSLQRTASLFGILRPMLPLFCSSHKAVQFSHVLLSTPHFKTNDSGLTAQRWLSETYHTHLPFFSAFFNPIDQANGIRNLCRCALGCINKCSVPGGGRNCSCTDNYPGTTGVSRTGTGQLVCLLRHLTYPPYTLCFTPYTVY